MVMIDFPKHNEREAEQYRKYRWWLGLTLGDLVDRAADVFPKREAVVDDRVRITYAALRDGVDRLATGLMGLGVEKGDAVLLQLPNWAEYVYSYFALQKIGAIPVVLISGYKQLEISHLGLLTEATAWIVPEVYRKMDYTTFIEEVRGKNPQLKHVISARAAWRNSWHSRPALPTSRPLPQGGLTPQQWLISYPRVAQRDFRKAFPGPTTITSAMWNICTRDGK
jgi:non-ribosomal peptide synthetase component E (peptide arylation enzyme)